MGHGKFVKVATVDEIGAEGLRVVVGGEEILIVKKGGDVFAVSYLCSHADLELEGGEVLEDGSWQCPHHGAKFDLETGAALSMPAVEPIETYNVKVEGSDVYVEEPS